MAEIESKQKVFFYPRFDGGHVAKFIHDRPVETAIPTLIDSQGCHNEQPCCVSDTYNKQRE
jgi:hypothetical protein